MHKSLLPALLCGLLLVTAGCTGLTGTESPTGTTATPADVPEDERKAISCSVMESTESSKGVSSTAGDVPEDERSGTYPPGVTAEGVEDNETLIEAHLYAAANGSFELSGSHKEVRLKDGGNSVRLHWSQQVTANTTNGTFLLNKTGGIGDDTSRTAVYQNQTKLFHRTSSGNETHCYVLQTNPDLKIDDFVDSEDFWMIAQAGEWNVTRIKGTEDQFRLQSNSFKEGSWLTDPNSSVSASNLSIDMVVRSDGRILEYRYSVEKTRSMQGTTRISAEYELSNLGEPVSIEKPDWVSRVNVTSAQPSDGQATTASSGGD